LLLIDWDCFGGIGAVRGDDGGPNKQKWTCSGWEQACKCGLPDPATRLP
jgi:hypothetical protein